MPLSVPSNVSPTQFYLIASARGVDANALATTVLDWAAGMTAANTIPLVGRVYRKTGTLSLTVASLRLNSTIIQPISAASSALLGAAADPISFVLSTNTSGTVMPLSGNWDCVVGTVNVTPATIDIEVWGFRTS